MKHKGHFGVSMGTIIKKKSKIKPHSKHSSNCKFFYKGICKQVAKASKGRQLYISDKTAAKKCVHYINKNDGYKLKTHSEIIKQDEFKAGKNNKIVKPTKHKKIDKELTIHEIVDLEILKFNKARERLQRYVSPFFFENENNVRKILTTRGTEQGEYTVVSGIDAGETKICSAYDFKNDAIIYKKIEKNNIQ
ncbi:hypothetical protein H1230_17085 [Paenibacillus sp. 19GGS1-52]|uniref:hypothetical protein n=1 Tax=Paenibacillus sp. 19GGS1-52 TaxID=2758563 RepID=UPI001EFB862A|nr:hypothetical protein [Paenibacillus sp. 19GGS1-52]ULO04858.1 hypothetical protein H1230_17085 [Paenibacillus sp. 19GGS1-52]